jgi:diguanylate cyclase (GGDEF)-like protein
MSAVRATDVVGRLGGDEFALVLLGVTTSDVKVFFNRLHKQLLEIMLDQGWESGVSTGVVTFSDFIPNLQDVINYADALMYKAKKSGKGKLIFEESPRID